ncbi:nucleotide sugar dehydrogenase [Nocardia higoensis]|uniref:Nucleotide sugar dehydrogenase n=1 Tax=Nocardia higoensis TaxID=228599 RepID=A0ABS0D8J2_9NOCA|nr:nucleotide sugar dehydrogenase [Nocardia higoensis]MBF6354789.1 nucleotide sugar dehydrogenase [Nocardia higoensis]
MTHPIKVGDVPMITSVAPVPGLRVAVIGCGYVGLPVAMLTVAAGHTVVAFDTDPDRVLHLTAGHSYVRDVATTQLRAALDSGRLIATNDQDDLQGFDVALIAVPTPTDGGRPDLSCIEAASKTVAAYLRPDATVVLESTTYPGTTETVVAPILESSGLTAGVDFHLGYAPERINPGTPVTDLAAVPKIVAGINDASRKAIAQFWGGLVEEVVAAPDIRTAELAKLIENAFRLVNISLVNELARYASALGASIWDALDLAATKPYGYMRFHPSVGAGGHCLPADTRYLAWSIREASGTPAALVETASRINDAMPAYVADRIITGLTRRNHIREHARIVVVGATYKPDVPDVRDSCALKVVEELRRCGFDVLVVDPLVSGLPTVLPDMTVQMVARASVVAVLVAHRVLDYALIASADYVFDACCAMPSAANIERL